MESVEIHGIDPQDLRANKLALMERLADDLAHEFSISHVTLQVETTDLDQCSLKPDDMI